MKALLFLFFVYFVEIFVVADYEPFQTGPVIVRSQKKKINSIVHKNLNILNRRYLKAPEGQKTVEVILKSTKKPGANDAYTVFPPIHVKGASIANLPDSPYFPVEKYTEYKPRVKKVLSENVFKGVIRKKRSADEAKADGIKKESDASASKKSEAKDKKVLKTDDGKEKEEQEVKKEDENKEVEKEKDENKNKEEEKKEDKNDKTTKKPKTPKKTKGTKKPRITTRPKRPKIPTKPKRITKPKKPKGTKGKPKPKTRPTRKPKSKLKPKPILKVEDEERKRGKKVAPKRLRNDGKKKDETVRRRAEKASRRLIASNDGSIDNYPYTISIQKDRQHWCSGALLNPRLAITTANCMWKADRVTRMRIRACSRYTDRGGQEAKIQEVMKHPQWSIRKGPDHDLALLYLDRMLRFSHTCHGVDLPNRVMYPVFEDAWITSWGAERRDGIYERPLTLQVYHANVIDRAVCNNITQRFGVAVSPNFICLAQTGRRAPCTRDTGAPAVSDGVLWGLASWGIRKLCGTERFPAMFSFTASHSNMDFISKATTYMMSEQRLQPFPDRYPFDFSRKPTLRPGAGLTEPTVSLMEQVVMERK